LENSVYVQPDQPEVSVHTASAARGRDLRILIPWILALFFGLWSLRAVSADNVVDTDAARHAMNGVFIRDLVATGNVPNVVDYGKRYYGRLPALSMPYHPPFFPALEAIFFAIFGVGLFPARLAVAVAVAVSALLLYRLIVRTVGSHWTAAAATITFLFWRNSQAVAGDVMLEFPCLVFLLAALHCLVPLDLVPLDPGNDGRAWLKRGLGFALFGAAALWSKQHALFLGMVPFALVALRRQWRSLVSLRLWVPPIILGLSAIGLTLLTLPFKATGVTQLVDSTVDISWFQAVVVHNFRFYLNGSPAIFGTVLLTLMVASILAWPLFLRGRNPGLELFVAWAACAFFLLLILGPYDLRYLFFVYPALLVIAYASLERVSERFLPKRLAWMPIAAAVAACTIAGLQVPAVFLTGPSEAASIVVTGKPERVLYCGSTDGNFIFAVRARDAHANTIVLSGEKLLSETKFSAESLEQLAEQHGIDQVVVEHTDRKQPCSALDPGQLPTMKMEQQIRMTSSLPRFDGGTLTVYRFVGLRQEDAAPPLKMKVPKLKGSVNVTF